MFNIGAGELLVICLVALIVLGPDKLPEAARKAGELMSQVRKYSSGFQSELRNALDEPVESKARERGAAVSRSKTRSSVDPVTEGQPPEGQPDADQRPADPAAGDPTAGRTDSASEGPVVSPMAKPVRSSPNGTTAEVTAADDDDRARR